MARGALEAKSIEILGPLLKIIVENQEVKVMMKQYSNQAWSVGNWKKIAGHFLSVLGNHCILPYWISTFLLTHDGTQLKDVFFRTVNKLITMFNWNT